MSSCCKLSPQPELLTILVLLEHSLLSLCIVCLLNVRYLTWVFTLNLHSESGFVCRHFPEEAMTAHYTCAGTVKADSTAALQALSSFTPSSKTATSKSLKCSLNSRCSRDPPGLLLVVCCVRGHPRGCPCYVDVLETQGEIYV